MSEKQKIFRPILRWPGGKRRMLKRILPMIPPHVCYHEPFFGGGAVLFAKPRSAREVINDINGNLVALYRNLQFHLPAVLAELDWMFSSRQNLRDFIQQPGLTELQRATRFLLVNRTSFGGNMSDFGVAKTAGGGGNFERASVSKLLQSAHARLDGVVVENLPYERCLKNYDSRDTFHFIDSPYMDAPTKAYPSWGEPEIRQLRRNVEKLDGQWIVTLNDNAFIRDQFSDCKIEAVETHNRFCNQRTHGKQTFGELIITPK